ncbi:MAG: DotA/TraY family protein [Alphaproteobacteria bacterium]|nr:DotA/TraY family protein [Alphaproteobacteria bacterium]
MLFSKRPSDANAPKRRSTLNVLFNPEFGKSLAPLRQTTNVFIMLLAAVFASSGLFPRNHPAFAGDNRMRLTFTGVIRTAWDNLSFTEKNIPQILFFFAVIISLVFSTLAFITVIILMFSGSAHAGPFSPESSDLAQGWIDYIFRSKPLADYIGQDGRAIAQSTVIQTVLMEALAFYSNAILIVAAAVLFYHLASMTVETAHHGVVMGKRANQVWAPIRLVVAVGLLVPISGGLNSGQYIVVKMAEWGSGLASQTWTLFVKKLAENNYTYVPPNVPQTLAVVQSITLMEACKRAYNYYVNEVGNTIPAFASNGGTSNSGTYIVRGTIKDTRNRSGAGGWGYTNALLSDQYICGSFYIPDSLNAAVGLGGSPPVQGQQLPSGSFESRVRAAIGAAHIFSIYRSLPRFEAVATQIDNFIPTIHDGAPPLNTSFTEIVHFYQQDLADSIKTNMASLFDPGMQQIADQWSKQGWIGAGSWFNTIARTQSNIADAAKNGLPVVSLPHLEKGGFKDGFYGAFRSSERQAAYSIYDKVTENLASFMQWMSYIPPDSQFPPGNSMLNREQMAAMTGLAPPAAGGYWEKALALVNTIALGNRVWANDTSNADMPPVALGFQFSGANPLAEIASIGHSCLDTAYDLIGYALGLAVGGAVVGGVGQALGPLGSAITGIISGLSDVAVTILGFLALPFLSAGFILAFIVPMIPFLQFFFGVLAWFVSLFEAVVAVPLIALAHLNPEGDGLPGPSAKAAYFYIFNLFVQPVLMVFGLLCGLLIFFVAASFLNSMFTIAVAGTGAFSYGFVIISRIFYTVMYAVLMYVCATHSFKIIKFLPDHAMQWMGGGNLHSSEFYDPSQMESLMGAATPYFGAQAVQQFSGAAQRGSGQITGAVGKAFQQGKQNRAGDQSQEAQAAIARRLESIDNKMP